MDSGEPVADVWGRSQQGEQVVEVAAIWRSRRTAAPRVGLVVGHLVPLAGTRRWSVPVRCGPPPRGCVVSSPFGWRAPGAGPPGGPRRRAVVVSSPFGWRAPGPGRSAAGRHGWGGLGVRGEVGGGGLPEGEDAADAEQAERGDDGGDHDRAAARGEDGGEGNGSDACAEPGGVVAGRG